MIEIAEKIGDLTGAVHHLDYTLTVFSLPIYGIWFALCGLFGVQLSRK